MVAGPSPAERVIGRPRSWSGPSGARRSRARRPCRPRRRSARRRRRQAGFRRPRERWDGAGRRTDPGPRQPPLGRAGGRHGSAAPWRPAAGPAHAPPGAVGPAGRVAAGSLAGGRGLDAGSPRIPARGGRRPAGYAARAAARRPGSGRWPVAAPATPRPGRRPRGSVGRPGRPGPGRRREIRPASRSQGRRAGSRSGRLGISVWRACALAGPAPAGGAPRRPPGRGRRCRR